MNTKLIRNSRKGKPLEYGKCLETGTMKKSLEYENCLETGKITKSNKKLQNFGSDIAVRIEQLVRTGGRGCAADG